jgi:CRISPR/Cas system-associated exonuclease Cas4 (RecB family)
MNILIRFLGGFCGGHQIGEKIFVVPSYQVGHQIGESLTKAGHSWVNLRFATLPSLVQEYAGLYISQGEVSQISESSAVILLNKVFSALLDEGRLDYFGELKPSPGIIRALYRSLHALRMDGIKGDDLALGNFINEKKGQEIRLILKSYEEELERNKFIDLPGLYFRALGDAEENPANQEKYFLILQNSSLGRLEREFLMKIAGERLILVPQDPVMELKRPRHFLEIASPPAAARNDRRGREDSSIDNDRGKEESERAAPGTDLERGAWLFAPYKAPPPFKDGTLELTRAIGPSNECREILRRITSEKIPLDDVEVVYPPGITYPSIFYVLSMKSGLQVTFGDGIPPGFTSPGKIFSSTLKWIEGNYQTSDLCRMIESGDLKLYGKGKDVPSAQKTSRYLKKAMIGWGRERYAERLENLKKNYENKISKISDEDDEDRTPEYEAIIKDIDRVKKLVKAMLGCYPLWEDEAAVHFGELCQGISLFLKEFSRIRNELDREAYAAIRAKLDEVATLETALLPKEDAFERLRILLEGIRVNASGPQPGHLHLSSFRSGGFSGRPLTFVVGLNQELFPGTGYQDPFLLDEERGKISVSLKTTEDSLRENLYGMAALISGLRGRAVLSYSSYDIVEERPSFPSSIMLQAFRLVEGEPRLDYSALLERLPEPHGFLPEDMEKTFDTIDWWMRKLSSDGTLYDGIDAVKGCFPELGQGIEALEIRNALRLSHYEGIIQVKAEDVHPLFNRDVIMSSSRFELLASCPFAYFLNYILGLTKPEEVTFDPSAWLDPLQRGSLIHEIFCAFMSEVKKRGEKVEAKKHLSPIQEIAKEIITRYKEEIPPPSEGVFLKEKAEVMQALDVFLAAEEKLGERVEPLMFEVVFGIAEEKGKGMEEPVEMSLAPDRSFRLRGRIDRIDRVEGSGYRVVDYKTGRYSRYDKLRCFGRGRTLQHVLYALAAEAILKKTGVDARPKVVESGYYFPTRRGEGKEVTVREFDREALKGLLGELLDIVRKGHFIGSLDKTDCTYCDFQPICGEGAADRTKAKKNANPEEFGIVDRLKDYK